MTNDLNLLPNVAKFQAQRLKFKNQIILAVEVFVGVWVLMVVLIFGLSFVNKARFNVLDKKYRGILLDMDNFAKDVVLTQQIKYKSKIVGNILNNRFEYGEAFDAIAGLFGPEISITNYDLVETGSISIQAVALGLTTMDLVEDKIEEINSGSDETFGSAELSSLAYDSNAWNFTMEVKLK